jgi:hypothetical protein
MCGSTEQIRSNWEHLDLVLSASHTRFASTGYGYHYPGRVAGLAVAPCAELMAYNSAGAGALGYAYDTGTFMMWRDDTFVTSGSLPNSAASGSWGTVTTIASGWSRMRAILTSEIDLASATLRRVNKYEIGTVGTYDDLGEFDETTGCFTASGAGYYLVSANIKYSAEQIADYSETYARWAALSASDDQYYGYSGTWGEGECTHDMVDVIYLGVGNKVCAITYHECAMAPDGLALIGGNFSVHRLI